MISIIIPAYNEGKLIETSLKTISKFMKTGHYEHEIIVVSDGSSDNTASIVKRLEAAIPHLTIVNRKENRGKGYSVREGFLLAKGEVVLFSDADLSTPIEELSVFLKVMKKEGVHSVIASRAIKGAFIEVSQSNIRKLMGMIFNRIVRFITGLSFEDTQCGFKLYKRKEFLPVFEALETKGFSFDVEIIMRAQKAGLKVIDYPVRWINHPSSSVRIVRDSLKMLLELVYIRIKVGR